jgi:ATP-dependent DNA ligase
MPRRLFEPCIPTRGTKVPAGPDWIHEIKHDGYRLIVQREGKRVRLFTRNGHDWIDRYPLIAPSDTWKIRRKLGPRPTTEGPYRSWGREPDR